ncbi:MAG TPA: YciI family protein [Polyangiaceae bacterium]|nr:YciI family protein [Polyangiaceae bacterium]
MSSPKFLFLYRTPVDAPRWSPSPEEMQAAFAQWQAWRAKFNEEIVDTGDGLKPTAPAAVYKAGTVTDGPFIEAKEVMAGYSIISAKSLERAIEIARECPVNRQPGASIEIRELAQYK